MAAYKLEDYPRATLAAQNEGFMMKFFEAESYSICTQKTWLTASLVRDGRIDEAVAEFAKALQVADAHGGLTFLASIALDLQGLLDSDTLYSDLMKRVWLKLMSTPKKRRTKG